MKPRSKPLRRTKYIKRGAPPQRTTAVRKVNRTRKAKQFQRDFGGAKYVDFLHLQRCAVSGFRMGEWNPNRHGPHVICIVAAHMKSRGAGGHADDLIPLDAVLHAEQHAIGMRAFARKYGTTVTALRAHAKALRARFLKEQSDAA